VYFNSIKGKPGSNKHSFPLLFSYNNHATSVPRNSAA
jgi:hypothetical protein